MRIIIFLSLCFCVLISCNQNGIGAMSAVTNFFRTPVDAVSGVFAANSFKKETERTREVRQSNASGASSETEYCLDESGRPVETANLNDISEVLANATRSSCQCEAWSNCPEGICACTIRCPQGFDIFKHPIGMTTKSISTPENSLAFRNGEQAGTIGTTSGYCWGHARVTSQFNRLAFFKPDSTPPYNLNSPDPQEQELAIGHYKNLIDKITSNRPVDIPGFQNLQALSSEPALQSYIADKVAKAWSRHAMSWQGIRTGTSSGRMSQRNYQKQFDKIKERIDMNMQPSIVFTQRGQRFMTHALLVSHYETNPDGSIKLCTRDSNLSESSTQSCQAHMSLHPENGLIYSAPGWGEIGGMDLAFNDDDDSVTQARRLREKCQQDNNCPASGD